MRSENDPEQGQREYPPQAPRVVMQWEVIKGKGPAAWYRLWARLLIPKRGAPTGQPPPRDALPGADNGGDSSEQRQS